MSREKELCFFVKEENWNKGIQWYQSNFESGKKIRGESTPKYTKYPHYSGVAQRMHSLIPEARLIYLVRDPIERIISHYVQRFAWRAENRSLDEALKDLHNNYYIDCSKYYMQIEQYLQFYSESQILVISQEDLAHHRRQTLCQIFRFLEVDDSFYSVGFLRKHNKRSRFKRRLTQRGAALKHTSLEKIVNQLPHSLRYKVKRIMYLPFSRKIEKPVMSQILHQNLVEYFEDDVHCLRTFTGKKFAGWCV